MLLKKIKNAMGKIDDNVIGSKEWHEPSITEVVLLLVVVAFMVALFATGHLNQLLISKGVS